NVECASFHLTKEYTLGASSALLSKERRTGLKTKLPPSLHVMRSVTRWGGLSLELYCDLTGVTSWVCVSIREHIAFATDDMVAERFEMVRLMLLEVGAHFLAQ